MKMASSLCTGISSSANIKVVSIKLLILVPFFLLLGVEYVFANNVVLNEIMANPTDNIEWVELYNPTDQIIDLSNWRIKDGNSLTSDDLTLTGQISPLSFITFDHTKGWLNDSGSETITLFDNNNQTVDSYQYSGTTRGKTYGRQPDGGNWVAALEQSKDISNGGLAPTPTPTATPSPSPTPSSTPSPTSTPTPKAKTTSTSPKTPAPSLNPSAPLPSTQNEPTTSFPKKSLTKIDHQIASVAAITASAIPTASPVIKSRKQINLIPWVGITLIVAGFSSLGYILVKNGTVSQLFRRRH